MSKSISLKSVQLKPLLAKLAKKYGRHAVFAAVLVVLLTYLLTLLKISNLATAEPTPDQFTTQTFIPKVDKKAIDQIQSLEEHNTEIHSLFEKARNNPFQE